MRQISFFIVITVLSCQSPKFNYRTLRNPHYGVSFGLAFLTDYHDTGSSGIEHTVFDSASGRYRRFIFRKNGMIESVREVDRLGRAVAGGTELSLINNRLSMVRMYDSSGYIIGPVFLYNKKGKLDLILEYNKGFYSHTLYARRKIREDDTLFIGRKFLTPVR